MSASQLFTLLVVWTVAAASPGPDIVLVLARAFASRRAGVAAAAGVVTGIAAWLAATFAGLATVLQAAPAVMSWMALVGGCFLAWMGASGLWAAWRQRRRQAAEPGEKAQEASSSTNGAAHAGTESAPDAANPQATPTARTTPTVRELRGDYLRGLATNLSNPKALVFFGAMLAPFLSPSDGQHLSAPALTGLYVLLLALAVAVFASIATLASTPALNRRIARALPWIELVAATLFVVVGLVVAVEAVRQLAAA